MMTMQAEHADGGRPKRHCGKFPQATILALFATLALPASADAADGHGHDHGGGAKEVIVSPRTEARVGDRQVVLVYSQGRLVAYLEGFADGEPVRGAEMEATVNFQAEPLPEVAPGVYQSAPVDLPGGGNEIEIVWRSAGQETAATLQLRIPSGAGAAGGLDALPVPKVPGWIFLAAALLLYAGITLLFWRRAARRHPDRDIPAPPAPHRQPAE